MTKVACMVGCGLNKMWRVIPEPCEYYFVWWKSYNHASEQPSSWFFFVVWSDCGYCMILFVFATFGKQKGRKTGLFDCCLVFVRFVVWMAVWIELMLTLWLFSISQQSACWFWLAVLINQLKLMSVLISSSIFSQNRTSSHPHCRDRLWKFHGFCGSA